VLPSYFHEQAFQAMPSKTGRFIDGYYQWQWYRFKELENKKTYEN